MMGELIYGRQYAFINSNKSPQEIRTQAVHAYQSLLKYLRYNMRLSMNHMSRKAFVNVKCL